MTQTEITITTKSIFPQTNVFCRGSKKRRVNTAIIYLHLLNTLYCKHRASSNSSNWWVLLLFGVVQDTVRFSLWLIAADFCLALCTFHFCGQAWGCYLTSIRCETVSCEIPANRLLKWSNQAFQKGFTG